ncbi:hypothetical protein K1719_032666 [Acacia pycnantha]|nr:hypothetical protein K1719_032666 [Acacia pycnantha]
MCRGDANLTSTCHQYVANATQLLSTMCGVLKEETTKYDECLILYFNHSIFFTNDTRPGVAFLNIDNDSNHLLIVSYNATMIECDSRPCVISRLICQASLVTQVA